MYHHRYQPQTSNPANETNHAFARNNHFKNSQQATARDYNSHPARGPVGSLTDPSTASSSASSSATYQTSNNSFVGHNRVGAKNQAYHSGAYFLQPKQFAEERQDVIFRRVRGILNKITPETFDKLSKELVNVGLDSPRTLRGLIYLLFDKALKDFKYSSLYAKLCQELSERSPNFEKEPGPNTFCKFLISKCEDEFERRRKANEDFDNKHELTDEEFEQKAIAKQKMLGNIKFICELGKKRLLQEEILHECIRGLLSKKKERPLQDQAQDLECLCQIMRTIGSLLDIEASKNLMNQYFDRIDMFSRKPELPSRIRFMLRDVIDLRNNNWRPRPFQREDTVPQPLSKLREESGFGNPASNPPIDKLGNTKNLRNISDLAKLHGNKLSMLLDDDGPSFTTTTDFHWGSSFSSHEPDFDPFSSGVMSSFTGETLQKPVPIKVSSTSASATAPKAQPVNQAQAAPYLGQRFSHSDRPIGKPQTQFDPFSNSHKPNAVRSGNNARESVDPDEVIVARRNDLIVNRSEASMAHDRKYFSTEEPRNVQSQVPSSTSMRRLDNHCLTPRDSDRNDLYGKHNSGNNDLTQGSVSTKQRSLNTHNEIRCNQDARRLHGDPSKQSLQNKSSNQDLGVSHNHTNRRLDDITLGPALETSMSHQYRGQVEPKQNAMNLAVHSKNIDVHVDDSGSKRDRMRERREFEQAPVRQPKFSGANYRLPGRDRGPPLRGPQITNRANQPPESESNLNWRSTEIVKPAQIPKPRPPLAHQVDMFDPTSRFADKGEVKPVHLLDNNQTDITNSRLSDDTSPRSVLRSHQTLDVAERPTRQDVVTHDNDPRTPSPSRNGHAPAELPLSNSDELRSRLRKDTEYIETSRRPDDVPRDQSVKGNRLRIGPRGSGDFSRRGTAERNEQQGTSPPIRTIRDRADTKPVQSCDTGEKFGGRSYRPAVGRNQSFDNPHSPGSRRGPDWRKENSASANNLVKKGENQTVSNPTVVTPLLPKAPIRISATDFTLRPSHNLVGRTLPDWANQSKPAAASESSKDSPNVDDHKTANSNPELIATAKQVDNELHNKDITGEGSRISAQPQNVNKFMSIFVEFLNSNFNDSSKLASRVKDLKTQKEDHDECIVAALKHSIVRSEKDRANTSKLLSQLIPSIFETSALLSAFRMIFDQLHVLEVETPKVKSLVAEFLSRAVVDGLLSIEEVAQVLNGGKHHPLFLLFLQKLDKSAGQAWLNEKFVASKVNLMDMLPEVDRTKDRLVNALKDRCLGFLDPMLTIEPDLWSQMRERDPSPAAVYRWIKDNVDQSIQSTPTFAHVFIACLLRYIHESVKERSKVNNNNNNNNNNINQLRDSDTSDSNKSSPTNSSSHGINDFEKELLSRYQQVMHALLQDKQMQLATLYALQSFYHGLDFPKGALLRWFHMLYDLSIVDDDVFFIWKEEINDKFPGKGQALFQVNTWLNWLAEAEDEEEEDV